MLILDILLLYFLTVWNVYCVCSMLMMFLPRLKHGWPNTCWRWTKWPALVSIVYIPAWTLLRNDKLTPVDALVFCFACWAWWIYRDAGDDDPMNKLKDSAREAVRVLHGRLVVVPQNA